jgi:hypothetical protein
MDRISSAPGTSGQMQQLLDTPLGARRSVPRRLGAGGQRPRTLGYTHDFAPPPRTGQWCDYQVRVLSGSRFKFYWNGELIFDEVDSEYTYSQGPLGMRLDYFDTILAETRVYQP